MRSRKEEVKSRIFVRIWGSSLRPVFQFVVRLGLSEVHDRIG